MQQQTSASTWSLVSSELFSWFWRVNLATCWFLGKGRTFNLIFMHTLGPEFALGSSTCWKLSSLSLKCLFDPVTLLSCRKKRSSCCFTSFGERVIADRELEVTYRCVTFFLLGMSEGICFLGLCSYLMLSPFVSSSWTGFERWALAMVFAWFENDRFWFVCGLKDLFLHLMVSFFRGKPATWKTFSADMAWLVARMNERRTSSSLAKIVRQRWSFVT